MMVQVTGLGAGEFVVVAGAAPVGVSDGAIGVVGAVALVGAPTDAG